MANEQLFLVARDIHCNRRRTAVRKITAVFAVGGQKSAYECWLTPAQRDRLCQKLTQQIDSEEDRLLMLRRDPSSVLPTNGFATARLSIASCGR